MISTFAILIAHECHRDDTVYIDSGTPTKPEFLNNQKPVNLPPSVKSIVSVAHAASHYALLHLKIDLQELIIYDGLGMPCGKWKPHMAYMLARFGISSDKWQIREAKSGDDSDGLKIVQRDGYNCGPIACMVLWKIFKPAMIDLKKIQQSQYRLLVVYELKRLLKIYRQKLVVFTKKPNENQVDLNTRLDDGEEADKKRRILPDRQARKTRK